jgi:hypothetical protein
MSNYSDFYAWKCAHWSVLIDWWGTYVDDQCTPGIMSGFEDFCAQAFERGVNP